MLQKMAAPLVGAPFCGGPCSAEHAEHGEIRRCYGRQKLAVRYYQDVLIFIWTSELEVAGGGQYGLDGSHAIVVVKLCGQLLRTQSIRRHNLDGQVSRVHEAVRVQTNFSDHRVVRHHHCHRTKQDLHRKDGTMTIIGTNCA